MQRVTHHRYPAIRRELMLDVSYDAFTHELEKLLGVMDFEEFHRLGRTPPEARGLLQANLGVSGFVLFQKIDHGALLSALSGTQAEAMLYVVGNALIAYEMTRVDPRAALYVPPRLFVHAIGETRLQVTYDIPSSQLDQFGMPDITAVAESLDHKLEQLVTEAANRATDVMAA